MTVVEARPRRLRHARLPDFPWDQLTAYAARARAHPDGIVDLSIGTPVDPTPRVVRGALRDGGRLARATRRPSAAPRPGRPRSTGWRAGTA